MAKKNPLWAKYPVFLSMYDYLIYVSTATSLLTEEELISIMQTSRQNNASLNITGLLLYYGGNIIQLLEGDKQQVYPLYEKIAADPRHKGALVLSKGVLQERIFPDWSMGLKRLTKQEYKQLPGVIQPHQQQMLSQPLEPGELTAVHLLKVFHRYNKNN